MRKLGILLCLCFVITVSAQQKKTLSPAVPAAAARICDDPYQVRDDAEGWPEGPAYILFRGTKDKGPWTRNPAIKAPGIETASFSTARTLVCVEQTRLEMGKYESGAAGYTPAWDVVLVRLADRKVYFMRVGFDGESPPEVKYHRGAGVGRPPTAEFVRWLRLIVDQKVARFKTRLHPKQFDKISALAFSSDATKLVAAQEPYDLGKPSPVTVFDLAVGKPAATFSLDYAVHRLAVSASGNMLAASRYGSRVEVLDAASGKVIHKFETPSGESVFFGPDDVLATAGEGKAAVWDVRAERELHSSKGFLASLSPAGVWLSAGKTAGGVQVQEMDSGSTVATFPALGAQDNALLSRDGKAMARYSILGASMFTAGNSDPQSLSLPSTSAGMESISGATALAPTRDGFAFGNSSGFVGIASPGAKNPHVFATDLGSIQAIAVSPDEKLIAIADNSGSIEVWEVR